MQAPGETNKHQLRTEATKKKLIEAAFTVFTRDGFEASRIEDIAAIAGFTRGAYYAHFESKSDIFFALLEEKSSKAKQKLSAVLTRCGSPKECHAAVRDYYVHLVADRQWAILVVEFKLYALHRANLHKQLAEQHRNIRKKMSEWFRQTYPEAVHPSQETAEFIRAGLEAAYTGLLLERSYDPKRLSEGQVRELLGKIFDALAPFR
jgi:AcrR family transcriptional regulator